MASILIAEDDLTMRNFLGMALERAGHNVVTCENGLETLSVLEKRPAEFDLLLADIVMPGMDGIELSQKATALHPAIKVMFITGFAGVVMDSDKEENANTARGTSETSPAPNILSKPFHLRDLVDQVELLLAA